MQLSLFDAKLYHKSLYIFYNIFSLEHDKGMSIFDQLTITEFESKIKESSVSTKRIQINWYEHSLTLGFLAQCKCIIKEIRNKGNGKEENNHLQLRMFIKELIELMTI